MFSIMYVHLFSILIVIFLYYIIYISFRQDIMLCDGMGVTLPEFFCTDEFAGLETETG